MWFSSPIWSLVEQFSNVRNLLSIPTLEHCSASTATAPYWPSTRPVIDAGVLNSVIGIVSTNYAWYELYSFHLPLLIKKVLKPTTAASPSSKAPFFLEKWWPLSTDCFGSRADCSDWPCSTEDKDMNNKQGRTMTNVPLTRRHFVTQIFK